MAKKFNSAIDKILGDTQVPKATKPQTHNSTNTHLHKSVKPDIHKPTITQKEPTERLDAMIPKSLHDRLNRHVFETNLTRKRGNKITKTSELIKALEAHLKNTNY